MEVPVYSLPYSEMQRRAIRGCRSWNGGPESRGVGQSLSSLSRLSEWSNLSEPSEA